MSSHARVGANVITRKSRERPRIEISSTGLRPKRSDIIPRIGPEKNCITPQVRVKTNCQSAAEAVEAASALPKKERMRPGRTGIIRPNDSAFITDEAKMNPNAAWRRTGER